MKKAHRQIESITMRLTALSTMGGTVLGLGVNTIHNPLYYKITQMKIPPQFFWRPLYLGPWNGIISQWIYRTWSIRSKRSDHVLYLGGWGGQFVDNVNSQTDQ